MGIIKTDNYSDFQNNIAIIAKSLGHPARVAIVDYIAEVCNCTCGDIVNQLPLAQPTVSQHLKELKNSGIIKGNIEGNAIYYHIDKHAIREMKKHLSTILNKIP